MKKLIIASIAITFAIVTQASNVNWGLSGSVDTTTYASGMAYLICVNDLAKPTITDDASAAEWYKDNGSSLGTAAFRSASVVDGEVYETEDISSPTGRKNYYLVIVNSDDNYMAISTTTKALNITTSSLNISAVWTASTQMASFSTASVPEPTSGLLMLLGMAGLALRRRRA